MKTWISPFLRPARVPLFLLMAVAFGARPACGAEQPALAIDDPGLGAETRSVKDKRVLLRVWSRGSSRFLIVDERGER
jgi:hypothetical protein